MLTIALATLVVVIVPVVVQGLGGRLLVMYAQMCAPYSIAAREYEHLFCKLLLKLV